LADKMTFIETPYAFADSRAADIEYEVGYFGGYSSLVRDIAPLYAVLRSAAYPSVIIGNGDVALQSEGALRVMPRASVDIVQQCILQVLEPICEAKFHERSNGFRPNRSTEHAIAQCCRLMQIQHLHYAVDLDIHGFFDNLNHGKLIRQMWKLGIRDKKLLCIIKQMLKAPIVL